MADLSSLKRVVPWTLAAASLWWVSRDFSLAVLRGQWAGLNWVLVAAAIGFDILTYVIQGARWSTVLRPSGRLSPMRATQAIYIGLFANEILPFRIGEVVRTYVAARWLKVAPVTVVPSLVMERLLDGMLLTLAVILTAQVVPFTGVLAHASHLLYVVVAVVAIAVPLALWLAPAPAWLPQFLAPFRSLLSTRAGAAAFAWSSSLLGSQCISFWLAMRSCGLRYPFWAGCAMLIIVRLGTLIPAAPANVGTFQFFCTLALTLFGVQTAVAASFSVLVFLMLTLPLWALGSVALLKTGMSLGELRESVEAPVV